MHGMSYKIDVALLLTCTGFVVLLIVMLEKRLENGPDVRTPVQAGAYLESLGLNDDLLDLKNFRYIIEPKCDANFLAWIVTSYAGDARARSALRRAYSNQELENLGITRVFLLGTLDEEGQRKTHISQNALLNEAERFNDILQGDFREAYRNLTYKHLMGLRWSMKRCNKALYIMKSDDDIVVNLYKILDYLEGNVITDDTLIGYVMKNVKPIRKQANKWFVTEDEYARNVYPDFLSGWLYLSRRHAIAKLINRSRFHVKPFWIDDVFITGTLREESDVKTRGINDLFTTDHRFLECCIRGAEKRLKCEFAVGPNGGDAELQVRFRDFAEACRTNCSERAEYFSVAKTCVAKYDGAEVNALLGSNGSARIEPIRIL